MALNIVPRKFKVSDDVSYLGARYDPRSPYPEKEHIEDIIVGIGPNPPSPVDWFYTDFRFRKKITVINNHTSAITDAPVLVSLDYLANKMKADYTDIRFTFVNSKDAKEEAVLYLK